MVTITDYKTFSKENGENFFGLVVQGGVEAVRSTQTGKMYFTAKTATVPTTFNETICKSLIGTTLEGNVKKVACDDYEYTVKDTGEIITLSHRYEYIFAEEEVLNNNLIPKEIVA
ncbi:hypothetical protein [Flavobacterium sp. UMI-01]|uniref:hypothetical protein n=1 Tax=Flavobacterium sp. UMI-01 TaxID=1441053 RepID=UPI001C7DA06C|nr:hypothetical protein [Flavobacterium sp. UMI-01]GIZ07902.1 hypothetical protein FUMI01_06290 [Flavobacterium sp. UMI-01]